MSKIHFLTKKFSKDSISYSRQDWKDLIQRILKNELHIFQQYQYKIEESERIYKISNLPLLCLPSREIIQSIIIQVGSLIQYSILSTHLMIIPSFIQRERTKFPTQKRVTIIPPKDTLDKRLSLTGNDSLVINSPKWCPNIDERSSDDLHQLIINEIRRRSSQEDQRRQYDTRLSLRSISYGFGLGTTTKKLPSPPNYRLPSNKIELDRNQQEILRRTSSLKKPI